MFEVLLKKVQQRSKCPYLCLPRLSKLVCFRGACPSREKILGGEEQETPYPLLSEGELCSHEGSVGGPKRRSTGMYTKTSFFRVVFAKFPTRKPKSKITQTAELREM